MTGIINKTGALKQRILVSRGSAGGGGGGAATFTAVADGAIAAGDRCIVTAAGKVKTVYGLQGDVWFGPSTTSLFTGWTFYQSACQFYSGYAFPGNSMVDRMWTYAQTLDNNPFASSADLATAMMASFKNTTDDTWGVKFTDSNNTGDTWRGRLTSPSTGSYFHWCIQNLLCLEATGNAPDTSSYTGGSGIGTWLGYKHIVMEFKFSADITNLTAANFIGFSDGAYADGANATVNLKGNVHDDNLSGLTTGSAYYITKTGTMSTTADDPSVLAGVALASDKLLVY